MDLAFLYILTLNGLSRSMSDLAHLTKEDGTIPRGRWLFVVCGVATIFSGFNSGPPIIISPESAAGIKAGAKTGLSTLVCGILFAIATFFGPLFADIPAAGTAPLLLMVGVLLFQNVKRIDWHEVQYSVPAFCTLFFIPFTYSILRGVAFGYVTFILLGFFTGNLYQDTYALLRAYSPVKVMEEVKKAPETIRALNTTKALEIMKRTMDYKEEDLIDLHSYERDSSPPPLFPIFFNHLGGLIGMDPGDASNEDSKVNGHEEGQGSPHPSLTRRTSSLSPRRQSDPDNKRDSMPQVIF